MLVTLAMVGSAHLGHEIANWSAKDLWPITALAPTLLFLRQQLLHSGGAHAMRKRRWPKEWRVSFRIFSIFAIIMWPFIFSNKNLPR
jgi:hypothetical protein